MLPAGTLAPRSLRRSKLLAPNTKLLLLAKEKKERERDTERERGKVGERGNIELKEKAKLPSEGISATQNNLEDQGWETGQAKMFGFSSLTMCPLRSETKHQGISHNHGHFWANAILKQEPWQFIPNVSPLARTTHLLWNQDTLVAPTQALAPSHSLACPKALPG